MPQHLDIRHTNPIIIGTIATISTLILMLLVISIFFIELRIQGDTMLTQRYQLLQNHERDLNRQINDLQETMSYLKFKKWYYDTAVAAETETIHFVAGSNEVKLDLDQDYIQHLTATGQLEEVKHFLNVRDYRN